MLGLALTNHAGTWSASSAAAGYPVSFLDSLLTPDIPWKSTATGSQSVTKDLGSAKAVDIVTLLYANFLTATLQADDAATFDSSAGSPQYSAALTLGELDTTLGVIRSNPGNGRICLWHRPPATVTRRYWRILIPSQTPTDGAAYYRLGAVLIVPGIFLRNFRWEYDPTPSQDIVVVRTVGGNEQAAILGPPRMKITGTRQALTRIKADGSTVTIALLRDQVDDWMTVERLWLAQGWALIIPDPSHPYWVGVMRMEPVSSRSVSIPVDDVRFEWREVA